MVSPTVNLTAGSHTFTLVVSDNDGASSAADTVTITVNPAPPVNQAPTANAGPDRTVTIAAGQTSIAVTLDGSGSSDTDGTIATYNWTGTPDPANTVSPTVNLAAGSYTFTLIVTDNAGATSAPDTVAITVDPAPPPAACNPVPTDPAVAHAECITDYTGPEVCVACHEGEARDMHGSVHYQQGGAFPNVTNVPASFYAAGERPAHPAGELVADGSQHLLRHPRELAALHLRRLSRRQRALPPEPGRVRAAAPGRPGPRAGQHRLPHVPPGRLQALPGLDRQW